MDISGISAIQTEPMTPGAEALYLYFMVNIGFYFNQPTPITLSNTYFDEGYEPVSINYDTVQCCFDFNISKMYRRTAAALDTYTKLGYPVEKIKPVLNAPFPRSSLSKEKIETAMGTEFLAAFPHVADLAVEAINLGPPLVLDKP